MKKVGLLVLWTTLIIVSSSLTLLAAEEEKPTTSVDVGFYSKYVWRGFELSKDSLVIQPSMTVGYKGFSMNLWGNVDTDLDDQDPSTSNKSEWNETDGTLAYDTSIGPVNLGVGYIYYGLDGMDDSQEIYLSASMDILLSPTVTIYREIAHLPGWYINFGISHSFELSKGITLDLAGSAGYYYSDDDDFTEFDDTLMPTAEKYRNLHDGLISAGLTIPFSKYFTIVPSVAYWFPLSSEADNLITASSFNQDDSDFFVAGVTLSMAF